MQYFKLSQIRTELEIDESLLETLATEELINLKHTLDGEIVLSAPEVDRLRLILLLMRELDVNLPGVEVILHMREDLVSLHQQFDEVLRSLVDELRKRIAGDE